MSLLDVPPHAFQGSPGDVQGRLVAGGCGDGAGVEGGGGVGEERRGLREREEESGGVSGRRAGLLVPSPNYSGRESSSCEAVAVREDGVVEAG